MKWLEKILTVRNEPYKFCWWRGGDAIKLVLNPPETLLNKIRIFNYRMFWKIAHTRFNEHWVNNEPLKKALLGFGIPEQKIKVKPFDYPKIIVEKQKHTIFNILFYLPEGRKYKLFTEWIYGKKYYDFLVDYAGWFPDQLNIVLVDGSYDMNDIFPSIDCYIKINTTQYNGLNWIGKQCLDNDIPVLMVNDFENDFTINKFLIKEFIGDNTKNRI